MLSLKILFPFLSFVLPIYGRNFSINKGQLLQIAAAANSSNMAINHISNLFGSRHF